ncbi:MAG: hypothetical protein FJW90_04545 [Actinobacteria bacterium]|nr:hypothetical protein [Actinomycetota bacterium]
MKKASLLLVAIALALFGLVACGGDDDETTAAETTTEATTGGGGSTVAITAAADGTLAYDQTEVDATAGEVTIDFDNPAALSHDVAVEDDAGTELGKTDIVAQDTATTTIDLAPGTYTFFCTVPGHREGGMEGTLNVK